jgi:hypothetical protein
MDLLTVLWSVIAVVLLLVPSAIVAYTSAVYAARTASRWSRLLAVGASGGFAVAVGSQLYGWLILPGLYSVNGEVPAAGLAGGFLFVAGIGFSLLFAIALAVVLLGARAEAS